MPKFTYFNFDAFQIRVIIHTLSHSRLTCVGHPGVVSVVTDPTVVICTEQLHN